ncbi:MAG: hypothetical protein HOC18_07460, partial [Candidatus Marinimicrobia bacterium]|nr:hypothetical protein [Candidatus Neomarinimicrobiota bacterium]
IITSSDNGTSWTTQTYGSISGTLFGITYGNSTYVAVGDAGTILTSSDLATWTLRTSGTTKRLSGVTHSNNTFIAVGDSGTILTSSDGISWTSRTSGTTNWLRGITSN